MEDDEKNPFFYSVSPLFPNTWRNIVLNRLASLRDIVNDNGSLLSLAEIGAESDGF